ELEEEVLFGPEENDATVHVAARLQPPIRSEVPTTRGVAGPQGGSKGGRWSLAAGHPPPGETQPSTPAETAAADEVSADEVSADEVSADEVSADEVSADEVSGTSKWASRKALRGVWHLESPAPRKPKAQAPRKPGHLESPGTSKARPADPSRTAG